MIVAFRPREVKSNVPKIEVKKITLAEGPDGRIIFLKRLAPDRIILATPENVYVYSLKGRPKMLYSYPRPEESTYIDATPKDVFFARYTDVVRTSIDGKKNHVLYLGEKPLAIAAYYDSLAVAFESRIDLFKGDVKYGSVSFYNASTIRFIRHRRAGAIIAANSHGSVAFINAYNQKLYKRLRALSSPIKYLAALSDGHTITAVVASSTEAAVVDSLGIVRRLEVESPTAVAIGKGVAYVAEGREVKAFSFRGRPLYSFTAHCSEVTYMDARPILATGSRLGGVTIRTKPSPKRIGSHVVHVGAGKALVAYTNDGNIVRLDKEGKIKKRQYVGIVLDLDAYGDRVVYSTPEATYEIVGSRTRIVSEAKGYEILAVSKRAIAAASGKEVIYRVGREERKMEFEKPVRGLKLREILNSTYLIVVADKLYLYEIHPRKRLVFSLETRARNADVAIFRGSLIIAIAGPHTEIYTRDKKIATILRESKDVKLTRNNGRLLLVLLGRDVRIRDITDINYAGEKVLELKPIDVDVFGDEILVGGDSLYIIHHKGVEEGLSRKSYGFSVDKIEGFYNVEELDEETIKAAEREGRLGSLVNSLLSRGVARYRGIDRILIEKDVEAKDLEVIYR